MGVFGYGPLDSDDAMTVEAQWQELVKAGREPAAAIQVLLAEWRQPVSSGREVEVIALLGLCLRERIPVDQQLKRASIAAINSQLSPGELAEWDDPPARRRALLGLLRRVGGKRKAVKTAPGFHHPQVQFRSTKEARRVLLRLLELSNRYGYLTLHNVSKGMTWAEEDLPRSVVAEIKEVYPGFLKGLLELFWAGLKEESSRIHDQATLERSLMCAAFVGMRMRLDRKEMNRVFERCVEPPMPEE